MIRINLLGVTKGKKKGGATPAVSVPTDAGSPAFKILVVLLVVATANVSYWFKLNREKQRLDTQMVQAERKNRELADVKAKYLERQRQAENYKRRVDVIDQLRANQSGPVNLLNMIGDTVNGTEAVWLNNMRDEGTSINIEGTALSVDAVANLITNLQKTGYFKNVEIKESYQDETYKEMQAFVFSLTCEKQKS
ncbi:MAG TPA: PilN domain-containing protein [Terriglobales bacterium]|nr:PilN domain-containing protein [Terriglobales bacterium]